MPANYSEIFGPLSWQGVPDSMPSDADISGWSVGAAK
jgi:hypothetical protein